MTPLTQKRFESPDEIREFTDNKGRIEMVDLGGNAVGRGNLRTGLALVGKRQADRRHRLLPGGAHRLRAQGPMALKTDGGTENEFGPGDPFHMPPGHNTWIVGDESSTSED
jgi:hypothetical protein